MERTIVREVRYSIDRLSMKGGSAFVPAQKDIEEENGIRGVKQVWPLGELYSDRKKERERTAF